MACRECRQHVIALFDERAHLVGRHRACGNQVQQPGIEDDVAGHGRHVAATADATRELDVVVVLRQAEIGSELRPIALRLVMMLDQQAQHGGSRTDRGAEETSYRCIHGRSSGQRRPLRLAAPLSTA